MSVVRVGIDLGIIISMAYVEIEVDTICSIVGSDIDISGLDGVDIDADDINSYIRIIGYFGIIGHAVDDGIDIVIFSHIVGVGIDVVIK